MGGRVEPGAKSSHSDGVVESQTGQTDRQTDTETERQSNERQWYLYQDPRVPTNLPTKFSSQQRLGGWPGRAPNHSDGVVESQTDRQTRETDRWIESLVHL